MKIPRSYFINLEHTGLQNKQDLFEDETIVLSTQTLNYSVPREAIIMEHQNLCITLQESAGNNGEFLVER